MPRVFISYRREDSQDVTGRIYDHLVQSIPPGDIFRDVDSIAAGTDFRKRLDEAISKSDLMLVIIGPRWTTVADPQGRRRLDSTSDFVRLEVETALKRGIPVIPVTVSKAEIPSETELPSTIRELAFRNGRQVRPDPDFKSDIARLVRDIEASSMPPGLPVKPHAPPGRISLRRPRPFTFRGGEQAWSKEEFLGFCRRHPAEGAQLVTKGELWAWLNELDDLEATQSLNRLNKAIKDSRRILAGFLGDKTVWAEVEAFEKGKRTNPQTVESPEGSPVSESQADGVRSVPRIVNRIDKREEPAGVDAKGSRKPAVEALQPIPGLPTNSQTFATFVVGDFNRVAHAAARSVAANPGKLYNPLLLFGKPAAGKTHLLSAIGTYIRTVAKVRVLFTTGPRLCAAVRRGSGLRDLSREAQVILVDDFDLIHLENSQDRGRLAALFGFALRSERQILLGSETHPRDLGKLEGELGFKIAAESVVELAGPDEVARKAAVLGMLSTLDLRLAEPDLHSLLVWKGGELSETWLLLRRAKAALVLFARRHGTSDDLGSVIRDLMKTDTELFEAPSAEESRRLESVPACELSPAARGPLKLVPFCPQGYSGYWQRLVWGLLEATRARGCAFPFQIEATRTYVPGPGQARTVAEHSIGSQVALVLGAPATAEHDEGRFVRSLDKLLDGSGIQACHVPFRLVNEPGPYSRIALDLIELLPEPEGSFQARHLLGAVTPTPRKEATTVPEPSSAQTALHLLGAATPQPREEVAKIPAPSSVETALKMASSANRGQEKKPVGAIGATFIACWILAGIVAEYNRMRDARPATPDATIAEDRARKENLKLSPGPPVEIARSRQASVIPIESKRNAPPIDSLGTATAATVTSRKGHRPNAAAATQEVQPDRSRGSILRPVPSATPRSPSLSSSKRMARAAEEGVAVRQIGRELKAALRGYFEAVCLGNPSGEKIWPFLADRMYDLLTGQHTDLPSNPPLFAQPPQFVEDMRAEFCRDLLADDQKLELHSFGTLDPAGLRSILRASGSRFRPPANTWALDGDGLLLVFRKIAGKWKIIGVALTTKTR